MFLLTIRVVTYFYLSLPVKESTARIRCTDELLGRSAQNHCDCVKSDWKPMLTIGGQEPDKLDRKYPFMVAIVYHNNLVCGGSLINTQYVLTAAHCVDKLLIYDNAPEFAKRIMLRPRMHVALKVPDKSSGLLILGIADYFIHPTYELNNGRAINDIAILQLEKPVFYTSRLKPICLSADPKMPRIGRIVKVIGFGGTLGGNRSTVLREVALPVRDPNECRQKLKTFLPETAICAGGQENQDSCLGDSGGPMFYTDSERRYYQVGIVSWGERCGKKGYPAVYTRISSFTYWIRNITAKLPFCEKLFPSFNWTY